jgi:hypothetical protein
VLLAVGATALAAHADVYKWKDKDGKTHFSTRPPADTAVTEVQGLNRPRFGVALSNRILDKAAAL